MRRAARSRPLRIRGARLEPADEQFLGTMLYEAAAWRPHRPRPPVDETLAVPEVARYLDGWGRIGDLALIAEAPAGRRLGAAWFRLFGEEEPGYGFVDAAIPELTIGVEPGARGTGVGTALLELLIARARSAGYPALSLSVERDNPARRLYDRLGFTIVRGDAHAVTMLLELT